MSAGENPRPSGRGAVNAQIYHLRTRRRAHGFEIRHERRVSVGLTLGTLAAALLIFTAFIVPFALMALGVAYLAEHL